MKQRKVETNDRFIAFDEYIGRKYGSDLKQLLQDDLYDGYDGSASIRIDRRSAKIESVVYWQDSASEISGIITYSAKCEIDIDGRTEACISEINIRVDACIGSDRIDCDFTPFHENISKARRQRPEDRLDRYLLPRAGKQRVEEICESILRHYCHDAIVRNEIVAPEDLAKALGLKIIRLPLCDMDNKGSLLITEETFLPVCSTYNKTDFVSTRIDGNTMPLIVSLDELKAHLRIEQDEEDGQLESLLAQAQAAAEDYCRAQFSEDEPPEPVRLAILLMASFYYENRDIPDMTTYKAMRMAFDSLLYPYRDPEKMF